MSHRHFYTPRPKVYKRPVMLNPLDHIKSRIALLTQAECDGIMDPVHKSHKAMREGVATHWDWCTLCTVVNIGLAIEKVALKGARGHLEAAYLSLDLVGNRATTADGTWRGTALHFFEMDAIRDAIDIFPQQLRLISFAEYQRARRMVEKQVREMGGRIFDAQHQALAA